MKPIFGLLAAIWMGIACAEGQDLRLADFTSMEVGEHSGYEGSLEVKGQVLDLSFRRENAVEAFVKGERAVRQVSVLGASDIEIRSVTFEKITSDGLIRKISSGPVVSDGGSSTSASWADFNGDGNLDLLVANHGNNFLYRNQGDGGFERITGINVTEDGGDAYGAAWEDHDNDGDPDLFVPNWAGQKDFLYRNEGDGTFIRVEDASPVVDRVSSQGASWVDVDNDGMLDLFVANRDGQDSQLYRNAGNDNYWLKVRCVGTFSNRSGVGAKVYAKAEIGATWQLRQISLPVTATEAAATWWPISDWAMRLKSIAFGSSGRPVRSRG